MRCQTDLRSSSVLGDNERSGAYASEQRRLIRAMVVDEVLAFTPYWRAAAAEVGLDHPKAVADLQALPARPLSILGPPESLRLRPTHDEVSRNGPRPLRRQMRKGRLRKGRATAGRSVLDPLYKPVHWIIEGETPVGCTEADLVRLAELGSRGLDLAGLGLNDAIVGLVPPGPTLSATQLALGARQAGIPLAGLSPSTSLEAVAMLGPTVLAGRPADLLRVLRGVGDDVRADIVTVLAVTRAPLRPAERRALEAAVREASVIEVWSPPGVRVLWSQCRGGEGVHTWPQSELIEVCGPDGGTVAPGEEGELIWTGLGWRGTVLVRLATGVRGRLVEGPCGTCGRTTPRILDASVIAGREAAGAGSRRRRSTERLRGSDPVVGRVEATGDGESVRTVRMSRKDRAAARAAAEQEPVPAVDPVVPVGDVEAAEWDAPPGAVRAVARDEPIDAAGSPAAAPATAPSSIGEVESLPPIPEVGPDAAGAGPEAGLDPWLPETGEVDAWPAPVLASVEGLTAWQVEHRRRRGRDELVVHLALAEGVELGEVLVSLERAIGATQYVVGQEAEVTARIAAADGCRIVDRRARHDGNVAGNRRARPEPVAAVPPAARRG